MRFVRLHQVILFLLVTVLGVSACSQLALSDDAAEAAWQVSAHSDLTARAFTYWDDEAPPEIPIDCAKCHSTPGYLNFLDVDGSASGRVEAPVPTGTEGNLTLVSISMRSTANG